MNSIDLYIKTRCEPCDKEEKCGYKEREHCAIISMALDSDRIRELKEKQMGEEELNYQQRMERYIRHKDGN